MHKCPRIFFSLDLTLDGQLVVLDKQTLEKAQIHKQINKTNFNDIKNLNVSDSHPLGRQFGEQKILTLDALLKILEPLNVVVILYASRTNAAFVDKFKQAISTHDPMFTKKIIFCCRSPLIIYKVRSASSIQWFLLTFFLFSVKKAFPESDVRDVDGQS